MHRALLIDDDVEFGVLVRQYLEPEGFAVEAVYDGTTGLERALAGTFDVVILDVMLPDVLGFDVLRRLRSRSTVPVLMLTARGDDLDRILGLEIGADDYLPKPFNPRELAARLRAILRRAERSPESQMAKPARVRVGDVELDRGSRIVTRGQVRIELTTVEFDLLDTLLTSAGQVVTREALVRIVLGREFSPFDRSIDVHVANLRWKLGLRDSVDRIKSIRGVGYLYARPEADQE
jgi:two-component system response regulator CpxR